MTNVDTILATLTSHNSHFSTAATAVTPQRLTINIMDIKVCKFITVAVTAETAVPEERVQLWQRRPQGGYCRINHTRLSAVLLSPSDAVNLPPL